MVSGSWFSGFQLLVAGAGGWVRFCSFVVAGWMVLGPMCLSFVAFPIRE
jgi:hypothetical protein